jgi:hypothetical protein
MSIDIRKAVERKLESVKTLCEAYALEAEAYAKEHTPWTDRTSDARRLLKGVPLLDEDEAVELYDHGPRGLETVGTGTTAGKGYLGFALVHRVRYGRDLETRHNGRYAVLKPAIEHYRKDFLEDVREVLKGS